MNFYTGTYTNDLDTKGRVVIPKDFRKVPAEILDSHLYMLPDWDEEGTLVVRPETTWDEYIDQIRLAEHMTVGEQEKLVAAFNGAAFKTRIDNQNRLIVPLNMRQWLGIDSIEQPVTLAFVGGGDSFRIYLAKKFEAEEDRRMREYADLLNKYRSGPNRRPGGSSRG